MPNHVDPINTGDPIRAEWLNKVASQAGAFPVIHGRGYADSDGVAFATGRGGAAEVTLCDLIKELPSYVPGIKQVLMVDENDECILIPVEACPP